MEINEESFNVYIIPIIRGRPNTERIYKHHRLDRYEDLVRLAQDREQWKTMTAPS